jgi:hypothetical protein
VISAKPDPKLAKFIAGMKAPGMAPDELQRRLKAYLAHDARLADIVRHQIFRTPTIKPKPKLDQFVRSYRPGRPAAYDESECRVLITQLGDMVDELGGAVEKIEQAEKVFAAKMALGTRDSVVFKTGEQCVAYLSKSGAELKKTLKSVQVPKANGKAEVTLKDVYAAASVLITAAVVVAEVSRRIVKWQKERKVG